MSYTAQAGCTMETQMSGFHEFLAPSSGCRCWGIYVPGCAYVTSPERGAASSVHVMSSACLAYSLLLEPTPS